MVFVSAQKKQGTRALFPLIKKAYDSASKRIGTGELNRFVETLHWEYSAKIHYITQASDAPADVRGLHGPAQSALFGGAVSDQPAAGKVRIRGDADRDQDQAAR